MFMNKKGVSPIIAAILLVVITIAIGATTMAFIRGLSDDSIKSAQAQSSQIKCGTDINLETISVGDNYKVCRYITSSGTNASWFAVTLRNKGFIDIKKFKLTVLGDGSTGVIEVESDESQSLAVNSVGKINISFQNDTTIGEPEQFVLQPIIQGEPGQDIYCTDISLKWDEKNLDETC